MRTVNFPEVFGAVIGLINEYVLHRRHRTGLTLPPDT